MRQAITIYIQYHYAGSSTGVSLSRAFWHPTALQIPPVQLTQLQYTVLWEQCWRMLQQGRLVSFKNPSGKSSGCSNGLIWYLQLQPDECGRNLKQRLSKIACLLHVLQYTLMCPELSCSHLQSAYCLALLAIV